MIAKMPRISPPRKSETIAHTLVIRDGVDVAARTAETLARRKRAGRREPAGRTAVLAMRLVARRVLFVGRLLAGWLFPVWRLAMAGLLAIRIRRQVSPSWTALLAEFASPHGHGHTGARERNRFGESTGHWRHIEIKAAPVPRPSHRLATGYAP